MTNKQLHDLINDCGEFEDRAKELIESIEKGIRMFDLDVKITRADIGEILFTQTVNGVYYNLIVSEIGDVQKIVIPQDRKQTTLEYIEYSPELTINELINIFQP